MPTYREQRDKIIEAYFKDEIQPFDSKFCFCGTLADNNSAWNCEMLRIGDYDFSEYKRMELPLLNIICQRTTGQSWEYFLNTGVQVPLSKIQRSKKYEDAIFEGMSAALDVLKDIHRSRGENVDDEQTKFTKRELSKV